MGNEDLRSGTCRLATLLPMHYCCCDAIQYFSAVLFKFGTACAKHNVNNYRHPLPQLCHAWSVTDQFPEASKMVFL